MSKGLSWFLSIVATLLLVLLVGAGYWLGQKSSFKEVGKVTKRMTVPETLHYALFRHDEDLLNASNLVKMYGDLYELDNPTRKSVENVLKKVIWTPVVKPAPFLGHQPSQDQAGLMAVNEYGFRDVRGQLETKAKDTIRIFMTGGSVAFGAGAKSNEETISGYLEKFLNSEIGSQTGYRYEVINTGVPAWASVHERILIENRLVDLKPDMIIMFSGNNDIHWSILETEDPANFWSYYDRNYLLLINNAFKNLGLRPPVSSMSLYDGVAGCERVAAVVKRNVDLASYGASKVGAKLVYALQPNILTSQKKLTMAEREALKRYRNGAEKEKPIWLECYASLRKELLSLDGENYAFMDLSESFGNIDPGREIFIDAYHFANVGNRTIARLIMQKIDWESIEAVK